MGKWQANETRLLEVGRELVPFKSWKGEEDELAHWVAAQAARWGGEAELMEVSPGRHQVNMLFRGNAPGRTLMFNGHLDIDPLAAGYKRDPWTLLVEGNKVYGAGMFNMRSGLLAMIEAAQIIRDNGGIEKGDLVLSFVVGELQGGVGTSHLLATRGKVADAVVVTEPYGAHNVITTHAGVLVLGITTRGISMHTCESEHGVNAIEMMAKVIEALPTVDFTCTPRPDLPGMPRINIGGIAGGRGEEYDLSGPNFMPDKVTIGVDVRFLPDQTPESVVADIRRTLDLLAAEDPRLVYDIEVNPALFGGHGVVMRPTDVPLDEEIVQDVVKSYTRETGAEPRNLGVHLPRSYGGDDLGHFWHAGIPGVLYGPDGVDGTVDEPDTYTYLDEMLLCASVLAQTAHDYLSEVDES